MKMKTQMKHALLPKLHLNFNLASILGGAWSKCCPA